MNRAVPALLRSIPAYNTLHVRAQCRELEHLTILVLVYRHRQFGGRVNDSTAAGNNVFNVFDVGLEEPLVLRVDLDVVSDHFRHFRKAGDALRVV